MTPRERQMQWVGAGMCAVLTAAWLAMVTNWLYDAWAFAFLTMAMGQSFVTFAIAAPGKTPLSMFWCLPFIVGMSYYLSHQNEPRALVVLLATVAVSCGETLIWAVRTLRRPSEPAQARDI